MEDDEATRLLAPLPEDERYESWHLVRRDGTLVGHGAGGVELLGAIRLTRPLARVVGSIPTRLLDRAYALVSDRRDLLARFVPDGSPPRRFP